MCSACLGHGSCSLRCFGLRFLVCTIEETKMNKINELNIEQNTQALKLRRNEYNHDVFKVKKQLNVLRQRAYLRRAKTTTQL